MIATAMRNQRASKKNWTEPIKGEVAWKVAKTLVMKGQEPTDKKAVLQALRLANDTLSVDYRKTQVEFPPWLPSKLAKVMSAVTGQIDREIDRNPPPELPRPILCPPPLPEFPPDQGQEEVPQKKDEEVKRLMRMIRTQQNQINALSDQIDSLTNLICEVLPHVEAATHLEPSTPVKPIEVGDRIPLIAVCGLHGKQRLQVDASYDHDSIELVYIDSRRKTPRQIGEFDHVIVTKGAGKMWWRGAKERFASASYANSASDVLTQLDKLIQK